MIANLIVLLVGRAHARVAGGSAVDGGDGADEGAALDLHDGAQAAADGDAGTHLRVDGARGAALQRRS